MGMKSISPIIATILIIVITVAIAGIFYAFTSGLFGSLTQSSSQQIQQQSQYTSFTINNVYCSNNIVYFNIYNNGNIPININNSIIIFTDNNGNTISINGSNIICNNGNIIPSGSNSLCYIINNYYCYYSYTNYIESMNFVYNGISYNYNIPNNNNNFNLIYFPNFPNSSSYQVTLYNTQSIPTPEPFQQDIAICNGNVNIGPNFAYINNATLFNEINPNGQNVMFFNPNNGQLFYSWYEGQLNYNGVTCDVWWVNIPNGIPANSNITIYMYIGDNSSNYYSLYYPYIGEAPYLSSTYGQYDNGNYVFLLYNNGTYLFPLNNIGSGGSESLITNAPSPWNYALKLSVNGGNSNAITWTTSGINTTSRPYFNLPNSYIAQMLVYITGSSPLIDLLTNVQSITNGQFYVFRFDARGNGYYDGIGYYPSGGSSTIFLSYTNIQSSTGVWYMLTAIDNNDYLYLYKNIVNSYNSYNLAYYGNLEASAKGVGYIGGGIAVTTDGATSTDYFTMIIVRAYPPNGVMPSIYIS
jgi:flagellin-like protein